MHDETVIGIEQITRSEPAFGLNAGSMRYCVVVSRSWLLIGDQSPRP